MSDYEYNYSKEPVEIFEETLWVVHDPWLAQDVGVFTDKAAAEMFATNWMGRNNG